MLEHICLFFLPNFEEIGETFVWNSSLMRRYYLELLRSYLYNAVADLPGFSAGKDR
jgi:hypothetical protein